MQRVQVVSTQQRVATWCCVEIEERHSRWQAHEHENNDQKRASAQAEGSERLVREKRQAIGGTAYEQGWTTIRDISA
jgi:hypothetical protein